MVELRPPEGGPRPDRKIRLMAPPREVVQTPSADDRRGLRWVTGIALLGLVGVVAAVFVVLPGWVETRQPDSPSLAASGSESQEEAEEEEPDGVPERIVTAEPVRKASPG